MVVEAIDFQKLWLQERKKQKGRRTTKTSNDDDTCTVVEDNDTATDADAASKLPPWPLDTDVTLSDQPWVSSVVPSLQTLSTVPPTIRYAANVFQSDTSYPRQLVRWLLALPEHQNNHIKDIYNGWNRLPHAQRRVAVFRAMNAARNGDSSVNDIPMHFPPALQPLVDAVTPLWSDETDSSNENLRPNHILINDYGDFSSSTTTTPDHDLCPQYILPHTDGPAYAPKTATLSLGLVPSSTIHVAPSSPTMGVLLHFQHQDYIRSGAMSSTPPTMTKTPQALQVHLASRSLVVFQDDVYKDYLHSIQHISSREEVTNDSCVNAPPDTTITRHERRISITIRHKKDLTTM